MSAAALGCDVVVAGGGPAGATAALRAARNGLSVIVLEQDRHPRFHIGESFLPRMSALLRELGLDSRVERMPRVPKFGASFAMGDDAESVDFWFRPGPGGEEPRAFSIERAPFDRMLLDAAQEAGARVFEGTRVRGIERLGAEGVELETDAGRVRARLLLDASGQATLVGKHLGLRRTLPDLCRVAYFQHFSNVARREGEIGGHPIIVMCDEGWFWMIPLDETRTSIGLVMAHEIGKGTGVPPREMLAWGIDRCPFVRTRMREAEGPAWNHVCADFSYTCRPYAGPGYFMVGDAATFVDPIFSTGVCLGMMSGVKAADSATLILKGTGGAKHAGRVAERYDRYVAGSSGVFFSMVRGYYGHGFREMFLNGTGPLQVHAAILSVLAGHVFPRPVFSLRWRLAFFRVLLRIHEHRRLVPARARFSLLRSGPAARGAAPAGRAAVGAA